MTTQQRDTDRELVVMEIVKKIVRGAAVVLLPVALFLLMDGVSASQSAPASQVLPALEVEQTFSAIADSTAREASPDSNYGRAPTLTVGADSRSGEQEVVLLQFDLSTLPAGAEVVEATLSMQTTLRTVDTVVMRTASVDGRWQEGAVTWNTLPGATARRDPATTVTGGIHTWDVSNTVSGWVNGSFANEGLLVAVDTGETGLVEFHSREGSGQAPSLTVIYAAEETLDLAAERDSWVDEENPSANYGGDAAVYVQRDLEGNEGHTLVYFDTSALPENATVISATLETYSIINFPEQLAPADVAPIQAEAVLSGWAEYGVTWNNRPPSVYLDDPPRLYQQGWITYDVTNIAQAWADGSVPNEGILLRPGTGDTAWAFFQDRSHGTAGPRLTIVYEEAPPPCTPLNGVTIDGPTAGQTGWDYSFGATVSPANATGPLTYRWSATEQASSSDATANYMWSTAGQKTVSLTVENCGGSASDSHTVTIEEPAPDCDIPLLDLTLQGPTYGATGRLYSFSAVASPSNADTPVTFTWEATDKETVQSSGDQLSEDRTWNWYSLGSKQISVTAENCGSSITRNMTIEIVEYPVLPDLRPGAPWIDALQGTVGFLLHNDGQNEAPSGHIVDLEGSGIEMSSVTITETIPGGSLRVGQFGDAWDCPWSQAEMKIIVDRTDVVDEGIETNNEYSALWPCDVRAPSLVSGPTVVNVSATTAQIDWTADEVTTGWLEYGLTGYGPSSVDSGAQDTTHSVSLSGLQPGTTYRMRAHVADEGGNGANSDWVYFETNTPGEDPPTIFALETTYLADHDYDTYILSAELDDADYVDRVVFFLDGQPVGADFSAVGTSYGVYMSPPEMGYTPGTFFEQGHTLEARAFTTTGLSGAQSTTWEPQARPAPVFLRFWDPAAGHQVEVDGDTAPPDTELDVQVFAVETDWKCSWGGSTPNTVGLQPVDCADGNPRAVQHLFLYLNDALVGSTDPSPDLMHTFTMNLGGLPLGEHDLRARARNSDYTSTNVEQTFELVRGEPDFSYERAVTRQDNAFEIRFSVTNEGTAAARVERVRDTLYGFQVIHRDHLPGRPQGPDGPAPGAGEEVEVWYTVRTTHTGHHSTVLDINLSSMDGDYVLLPPGETFTVFYHAVPILHKTPQDVYRMGAEAGDIFHFISYREDYDGAGLWTDEFFAVSGAVQDAQLGGLVTLHQSVMAAAAEADYLIVTSPYGLQVHASDTSWANVDPTQEREKLYSDMAQLARLAQGVIGYYTDPYAFNLDELLEPGGYWYDALHPNFRQTLQGYVLFVGEHEVLPVLGAGYDVPWSDLRYASTEGDARPELVLGRLVGDDVATLRRPLDAAIRFHQGSPLYDHSHALLYAGREEGEGSFWDSIRDIDHRLPNSTDVVRIRSEAINTSQEEPAFLNNMADKDIIVYRGHGYTDGDGFGISDESGIVSDHLDDPGDFGNARPFIMALACSAGDYEEDDDYGIAEASMRGGAAVFIGSTNLSYRYRNSEAARWFFNRFNAQRSVGDTFADLLRDKFHEWSWGDDVSNMTEWGRWAYQYQLYGDPKYGRLDMTAAAQGADGGTERTLELPGSETLAFTLGELEVAQDGGWHIVNVPDGGQLQGEGQYMVPVQQVIAHYPAGVRVQDVQLTVRSGLVVTSGLNIPISYFRQDGQGVVEQVYGGPSSSVSMAGVASDAAPDEAPNAAWVPAVEQPYSWRVAENGDGSSDLLLTVYPFFYDPATTDARYYRNWTFEVQTTESTVAAGALQMSADRYGLGQTVSADLALHNSGAAQDVVVSAVVHDLWGAEVAGLPLRTLHGVEGEANVTLQWDSTGIEAGDYVLLASLRTSEGQELDSQQTSLTLGLVQAEGLSLEAGAFPSGGGGTPLALTVRNSGDTTIGEATAHLRVQNVASGEIVARFEQKIVDWQPGSEVQMDALWDDAGAQQGGATPGTYRVLGYVSYGGTVSEALVEVLGQAVYLPMVIDGG